jgi:hypothetical protein
MRPTDKENIASHSQLVEVQLRAGRCLKRKLERTGIALGTFRVVLQRMLPGQAGCVCPWIQERFGQMTRR